MLSIGPGICRSSGGYSVESQWVYLIFKNSPGRNSPGLLLLLRQVLLNIIESTGHGSNPVEDSDFFLCCMFVPTFHLYHLYHLLPSFI